MTPHQEIIAALDRILVKLDRLDRAALARLERAIPRRIISTRPPTLQDRAPDGSVWIQHK